MAFLAVRRWALATRPGWGAGGWAAHNRSISMASELLPGTQPLVEELVDGIGRIEKKMGQGCSAVGAPTVAFLFASGQSKRELKAGLKYLSKQYDYVVGADGTSVSAAGNDGTGAKSAALLVGHFPHCEIFPFSTEEPRLPVECLSLFPRQKDEQKGSNRLNFLFFSTPSFEMDGLVRPISNLFSTAAKVGAVANKRVFLGSSMHESGSVGLAIRGNLVIDTVTVQPYRAMFIGGEAFPVTVTDKVVDTFPVPISEFAGFLDDQLHVSFDEDGDHSPVRRMTLVSEFDAENESMEDCLRVSGPDIGNDDVGGTETMMRIFTTHRGIASMNLCKATAKYAEIIAKNDLKLSCLIHFSSLGPDSEAYYGIRNHDALTAETLLPGGIPPASVGLCGQGGVGSCSSSSRNSTIFEESIIFAAFRQPIDDCDMGQDVFVSHEDNFKENILGKPTMASDEMARIISNLDYSVDIFHREDLFEKISLPLFRMDKGYVLLPGVQKKIHIFEPRYRFLVKWCLQNNEHFGIYGGDDVGFVVKIVDHEETNDGRFFVTLEGIERFYLGQKWCRPGTFGLEAGHVNTFSDGPGDPKLIVDALEMKNSMRELIVDCQALFEMVERSSNVEITIDGTEDVEGLEEEMSVGEMLQQEENYIAELTASLLEIMPTDDTNPELISFWCAQGLEHCYRVLGDEHGNQDINRFYDSWIRSRSTMRRVVEITALIARLRAIYFDNNELFMAHPQEEQKDDQMDKPKKKRNRGLIPPRT